MARTLPPRAWLHASCANQRREDPCFPRTRILAQDSSALCTLLLGKIVRPFSTASDPVLFLIPKRRPHSLSYNNQLSLALSQRQENLLLRSCHYLWLDCVVIRRPSSGLVDSISSSWWSYHAYFIHVTHEAEIELTNGNNIHSTPSPFLPSHQ